MQLGNGHVMSPDCTCEECRKVFHPTIEEKLSAARERGDEITTRIEIEYESGEVWRADGTDAFQILEHWRAGEIMNYVRGFKYSGPVMKKIKEKNQ